MPIAYRFGYCYRQAVGITESVFVLQKTRKKTSYLKKVLHFKQIFKLFHLKLILKLVHLKVETNLKMGSFLRFLRPRPFGPRIFSKN